MQTYRNVVRESRTHPEAKSAGPDGKACERQTVGVVQRREVRDASLVHVGKEANKLEEVEAGLQQDPEVIYTECKRPDHDVPDLFGRESSRYPTSGAGNPTFTIPALTLRTADYRAQHWGTIA